jgi:hypothetical protein
VSTFNKEEQMDAGCRLLPAEGPRAGFRARVAVCLAVAAMLAGAHAGAAPVSSPEHWKSVALGKGLAASFPDGWPVHADEADTWRAVHSGHTGRFDAVMLVHVESRRTHDDAVKRLAQIEFKHIDRARYALVGGWPGLERKVRVPYIEPGESGRAAGQGEAQAEAEDRMVWHVTTAVVVDLVVVEYDTWLQPGAPESLADEALVIGRKLRLPLPPAGATETDDLARLRSGIYRPPPAVPKVFAPGVRSSPEFQLGGVVRLPALVPSAAIQLPAGAGEIEAAVSGNGAGMLVAASCNFLFSNNSGTSFSAVALPLVGWPVDGDCGVAWGKSGAFYVTQIGGGTSPDTNPQSQTITVYPFTPAGQALVPPQVTAPAAPAIDLRTLTDKTKYNVDQPHLAADTSNLSRQGKDLLYLVWQGASNFTPYISCSSDGGANWRAPLALRPTADHGYPRVAVAPSGLVYVTAQSSQAGNAFDLFILSNCDNGLSPVSDALRSFVITPVGCPVPGLDRCNNGNMLSSPTIAFDQNNVAYVGFAAADGQGGENVSVWASRDGGDNFFPQDFVSLNSAVSARRYLPWLTAANGGVYAGWYDRRNVQAQENDLARYFVGSASWVNGQLVPALETDVSGVDDPQCKSGFSPNGVRSPQDCSSCVTTPATNCANTAGNGSPKYGDYNGIASGGNRLLAVWASATAPPGLGAVSGISAFASVMSLCPGNAPVCGGACCGVTQSCVGGSACCESANVCAGAGGAQVCCNAPSSCGGGGVPEVCGCTPLAPGVACDGSCGRVSDACGGSIQCPGCAAGLVCYNAECIPKRCLPKKCAKGSYWDPELCHCVPGLPH